MFLPAPGLSREFAITRELFEYKEAKKTGGTNLEIGPKLLEITLDRFSEMHIILFAVTNTTAGLREANPSQIKSRKAHRSVTGAETEMGRHRFIVATRRTAREM
jgi:hypothetical protein